MKIFKLNLLLLASMFLFVACSDDDDSTGDVVDPDHPQNFVGQIKSDDPQSIIDARPDRTEPLELSVGVAQFDDFDLKISPIFGLVGIVTVTTS